MGDQKRKEDPALVVEILHLDLDLDLLIIIVMMDQLLLYLLLEVWDAEEIVVLEKVWIGLIIVFW